MLKSFLKHEREHRQFFFLFSMLFLIIVFPYILGTQLSSLIYTSALSLVLLAGIYVISEDKNFKKIGSALGAIAIIAGFLPFLFIELQTSLFHTFTLVKIFLYWIFFSFTTIVIIIEVISGRKITSEMSSPPNLKQVILL